MLGPYLALSFLGTIGVSYISHCYVAIDGNSNTEDQGGHESQGTYSYFARNRIPQKVRPDNGPPYDSQEYSHYVREWGFQTGMSSQKVRHRELCRQLRVS